MGNFFCGAERNEIRVFNFFVVVGDNTISSSAAKIGIQQSIRDLIFLGVRGETNNTYFLGEKCKVTNSKYKWSLTEYDKYKNKSFSPLSRKHGFSQHNPRLFEGRFVHLLGCCSANPADTNKNVSNVSAHMC